MIKRLFYTVFSLFLVAGIINAQETKIKSTEVFPGEISIKGFNLSSDTYINIDGNVAFFDSWDQSTFFYAWIIKSDTREVVWHLLNLLDSDDEGVHKFDDKVKLDAGNYELYYAGSYEYGNEINNLGDFLDRIFSGNSSKKRKQRRDYYVQVSAPSKYLSEKDPYQLADDYTKNAVVSVKRVGDYENIEKTFSLKKDTKIRIYGLGEGRDNTIYDYAWIYDPVNNKKIWQMEPRRGFYAGGGEKNLRYDDDILLPAGNYILTFVTDGSHSFDGWNVMPPEDPQFWGVTLFPKNPADIKNVGEYDQSLIPEPVVSITKVWDNEFISQGFTLSDDTDLRILALGEGNDGQLSDYGWIINAETRTTVWDMNKEKTKNAGGAYKNRLTDQTLKLGKGHYIVYYKTDDSHSYEEWNSTPPFLKDKWGITLWTVNKDDEKNVTLFSEKDFKNENLVVGITRVRDNENLREPFTLKKDTRLRIVAIGEGDRESMFDYGWIENEDTGRIVWDMTYRKTTHAGGAKKNRLFNDMIILPAGRYYLHYKTDGSHSYRDWNANPPLDEEKYGISLYLED